MQPYLNKRGDLIIPHDADPKYHFWREDGLPIYMILEELDSNKENPRGFSGRVKILRDKRSMKLFKSLTSWILINLRPVVNALYVPFGWTGLIYTLLLNGFKYLKGGDIKPMMRLIAVCLLPFFLVSCAGSGSSGASNSKVVPKGKVVLVLLDQSGSFKHIQPSIHKICRVVDGLQAGDIFVIRSIDSSSFEDQSDLLCLTIPKSNKPIDPQHHKLISKIKTQVKRQLQKLKKREAARTDIWGAIYGASRFLGSYPDSDKYLLIFSDLEDNQGLKGSSDALNLSGIKLKALFVSRTKHVDDFDKKVKIWASAFKEAGAESVEILDPTKSKLVRNPLIEGG
jgi:hypothetical protein